jgi:hypothetical protein
MNHWPQDSIRGGASNQRIYPLDRMAVETDGQRRRYIHGDFSGPARK